MTDYKIQSSKKNKYEELAEIAKLSFKCHDEGLFTQLSGVISEISSFIDYIKKTYKCIRPGSYSLPQCSACATCIAADTIDATFGKKSCEHMVYDIDSGTMKTKNQMQPCEILRQGMCAKLSSIYQYEEDLRYVNSSGYYTYSFEVYDNYDFFVSLTGLKSQHLGLNELLVSDNGWRNRDIWGVISLNFSSAVIWLTSGHKIRISYGKPYGKLYNLFKALEDVNKSQSYYAYRLLQCVRTSQYAEAIHIFLDPYYRYELQNE